MDNQSKRASKTEFFRIYPVLIKGIEDLDTIHKFHKIFTKQKINEAKNELKNINKKLQNHPKKSSVSIKTSKKLSSINDKIINLNKSLSKQNSKFDSIDSYENLEKSEKDEIFKDLNLEEKTIMNKFMLSCINCMGIYSEEMKKIRKLKKERND